jgi:hypothetical protein
VSDEEAHSGSRWEPQQPSAADQPTERHEAQADGSVALAEAEHPATTPNALPPNAPSARTPRTGRGRRAVLAAIGAGLLLVGGGAGYAIGHATAAAPAGAGGAFGHGHGGFRDGQGAGPGGAAGGTGTGTATGTGTSSAGSADPST